MRRILLLITVFIVYGTLYPWQFHFAGEERYPLSILLTTWPAHWGRYEFRDAIINLALYLPFGAAAFWSLPKSWPRAPRIATVLLAATVLSACLEMLQVYVPTRTCSLADLLCNAMGAAIGTAVAVAYHPAGRRGHRAPVPPGALLLLVLFAVHQLYPFFPILSQTRLFHELNLLQHAGEFSIYEVGCTAAEWFAALLAAWAIVTSMAGARLGRIPPTVILLCLPLRPLIMGRQELLHEVLGAALAWLLWMTVPDRFRLRVAAWCLAAALLIRELAPFHFSVEAADFNWVPFAPTFSSEPQSALLIVARKAFDYGAMVWLLAENGLSTLRAGVGVAAGLMMLEWLQRHIPGRTPEATDAVLTLVMAAILLILRNFKKRQGLG